MIEKAIFKINPNAEFSINADDIDQITWLNGTTPISKSDIQAQISAVEFDTAMEFLRIKRNKLLRDTDFYALSDVTMSSDMQTYRQKLRDMPTTKTATFQELVLNEGHSDYPTKPS